jgi:hypothetical protein
MTQTPTNVHAPVTPGVALLGPLARGAVVVAALALAVRATGAAPAGSDPYVALGAGAALLATGIALVLHGRIMDRRFAAGMANDPRLIAGRLQGLLAVGLLLKLFTVTVGVLWLRAAGVKFGEVATFGVAFAAASLVCQLTAAGSLVRSASRQRGVAGDKAGSPAGEPS